MGVCMDRQIKTRVRGAKVKEYIRILSRAKLTAPELAFMLDSDYYRVKNMLYYIMDWHKNLIKREWNGSNYVYWVEEDVAREVLKNA